MNKRMRLAILCLVAALVACSQENPAGETQQATTPAPTPEVPVITSITEMPSGKPLPFAVSSEEPKSYTPTPRMHGLNPFMGRMTNEELILRSDVIVHASLLSATSTTAASTEPGWPGWKAVLEFRFRVHEYLKGSGPNQVTAIVTESHTYNSEAEAQDWAPKLLAAHDSRWDNREAILFLAAETYRLSDFSTSRLWLGILDLPVWDDDPPDDGYSLRSYWQRLWLPAVSEPSSDAQGASSNDSTFFLLDVPAGTESGGALTSTTPTISLGDMKSLVSRLQAEASGTDAYRQCVEGFYETERVGRYLAAQGWTPDVAEASLESGQPGGTLLYQHPEFHSDLAEFPDPITAEALALGSPGKVWFEGEDAEIVSYRVHDFESYFHEADEEAAAFWRIYFTVSLETTRPLPAGAYQFFLERGSTSSPACTKVSQYDRPNWVHRVSVTPPEGVVHEAFFDPVDIGESVGADGSKGILEPAAFSLDSATTTISSLKWENGTVTMGLSPAASLSGNMMDIIDVTGTTTLSLSLNSGSTTALAWSVPEQPWSDGDLLMLRIGPASTTSTVTNVLEPASAPQNLSATSTGSAVRLEWDAPDRGPVATTRSYGASRAFTPWVCSSRSSKTRGAPPRPTWRRGRSTYTVWPR